MSFSDQLQQYHRERELETITPEEVGRFLELKTMNKAKSTRRLKYVQVTAFFNFRINERLVDMNNPCAHPMIARQYKNPKPAAREILDNELVDQLLYGTRSPHDFRRRSATYASRNGVPLEIVSIVLLRHHDLKTTRVSLGKSTDTEAIRWMDVLHGM